jgi:AcrR family transcriptional regulator
LRGEHARERVLRAALEVLAERGLPGFTMDAIAERAEASKATLYRRWTSRANLLLEAMDQLASRPFPLPRTGSLRSDLVELVSLAEGLLAEHSFPRLMAAFIDAAERDSSLQRLHDEITERRREPFRRLLQEARRRGEIPASADVELAVDLLTAPLFYRRFIAHRPFDAGYAAAIVDHVLTGLSGRGRVGSSE